MEKKAYETAEMEIINVEQEDVIRTSGNISDETEILGGGLS